MEINKVLLHGAGGHGRVVLTSLLDEGREVAGMFDPAFRGEWNGIKFLGAYDAKMMTDLPVILSIGSNSKRKELTKTTRHRFTNTVHPGAYFSRFASIGTGSMVLQGVIVQQGTIIGNHVILNTACRIDHDCIIHDFVHVAPGVVLNGNVEVGEGSFIGAGAVVIPGVKIGPWSVIGAGSVVIKDIPGSSVGVGNPARIIKGNNP